MISLNYVLNYFEEAFNFGRDALRGEALSLFHILTILEVIFAGLYLALGSGGAQLRAAKRILFIGFLLFVIQNYDTLASQVIGGFIHAGELAGGSSTPIATFHNPDAIVSAAFAAVAPGMEQLKTATAQSYFGLPTIDALITLLCMSIGLLAFFFIAIQAFITYLEFLLITSVGLVLIPFGVFKPTAFLAEKTFGAIVGFGIKLMVLAVILAVTSELMGKLAVPDTLTWQNGFNFVLISLALAFLSWHAPSTALTLLHGQPAISLSTAAATAVTAGAGTVALGAGAVAGGAMATKAAIGLPISAGAGLTGMASAGYQLGSQGLRQSILKESAPGTGGGTSKSAASVASGLVGAATGTVAGTINSVYRSTLRPVVNWGAGQAVSTFRAGQSAVPLYSRSTGSKAKDSNQQPVQSANKEVPKV